MAINDISLTAGMRSNLISLQGTVDLLNRTQERLSTGKKVNTALDNPLNYFAAKDLNTRASLLAGYKDGMSEAVQTIKAANAGISAIEGLIAQAKAVAATAKAGVAGTITDLTIDLASVTAGQTITVGTNTFTATDSLIKTIDFADIVIGDVVTIAGSNYTGAGYQKEVTFGTVTAGQTIQIGDTVYTATAGVTAVATQFNIGASGSESASNLLAKLGVTTGTTNGAVLTFSVSTSVGTISEATTTMTTADHGLTDGEFLIAASGTTATASAATNFITEAGLTSTATSSGQVVTLDADTSAGTVAAGAENTGLLAAAIDDQLSDTDFYVGGDNSSDASSLATKIDGKSEYNAAASGAQITLTDGTSTVTGSTVGGIPESTFTVEVNQDDADRASYAAQYKSILDQLNLLATDSSYKGINFLAADNTLDVEFGSDESDKITLSSFDASAKALLEKQASAYGGWATNADVDEDIAAMARATSTLTIEASRLSSGLSIINTRQDWVKAMVNTVTEGADKLTLADMNEEGANMLMLQTRQTLGTTALSLSAQAAQSVLRLFA